MNDTTQAHVIIERSDGSLALMAFQCYMRAPSRPTSGGWLQDGDGFSRVPTTGNVQHEVDRAAASWAVDGVKAVAWRFATTDEVAAFNADRSFRNALRQREGKIEHDMPRARECARQEIRRRRAMALPGLDAQWMRASGQGKKAEADKIDAERQRWRDAPADPRIDAAQTVEELKTLLPGG